MTDDTQGKLPEEGKVEETQPQDIPAETKPTESEEQTLPDGASERTKEQFEKLKEHNAQLKEELQSYKDKTSVLDDLRPSKNYPNLSQAEVKEAESNFVDENGYVDVNRLNLTLKEASEKAKQAEERAMQAEERVRSFEESVAVKNAHAQFPQLDPRNTDNFDPNFYEAVRNELVSQMMKGKQDIVEAAQKVLTWYKPTVDVNQAKEEAVQEYKSKVTKREQATSAATTGGYGIPNDLEELRERTLKGDDLALYRRLQASGN